jgi:hypothetical protein
MPAPAIKSKQRPRELRRRVVVPARVRAGAQWSDACILNISSRGLLIHSLWPAPKGSTVQVVRGDHLIVARVMWSEAGRSGLQSDERLPVDEILSLKEARPLQLIASNGAIRDRRKQFRGVARDARLRGRAIEFLAVGAIAVALSVSVWGMAEHALAAPLARATAALGG